jgi:hypothetical protein
MSGGTETWINLANVLRMSPQSEGGTRVHFAVEGQQNAYIAVNEPAAEILRRAAAATGLMASEAEPG